jgi:hypothetical protein
MVKKIILIILILSLFITSCGVAKEKQCTLDSDCRPASCCHSSDAVNKDNAPSCKGILCSQQCEPNTIDCGQGKIKCLENECQAVLTNSN